jgi:ubiquinone/menaquinone biosynthesis C-methylase UbiE
MDVREENQRTWEATAEWWDDQIGPEGNEFHSKLIAPAQMRLLDLKRGETVLDIACGNGQFAREMARAGVNVVAFDFTERFLARARKHTEAAGIQNIEYQSLDATDENELLSLGERRFDAAVCTMALMDMTEIAPLMRSLTRLLKPSARFVFSVTHPCFNGNGIRMCVEEEDRDGTLIDTYSIKVVEYLKQSVQRGIGIIGQQEPHYYFHRPLQELLNECFRVGMVMDGIEEPAFPEGTEAKRALGWGNYQQIPPALVVGMRVAAG